MSLVAGMLTGYDASRPPPTDHPGVVRTYAGIMADAVPGRLSATLLGMASASLGAGVGELAAGLVAPAASPFAVVGGALIDVAPPWAKDAAIALFGTDDKVALLVGIALALLGLAALAGLWEARRPPWGRVALAGFGVVGAIAAVTRADAGGLSWLPSTVAGAAAATALWLLTRMARSLSAAHGMQTDLEPTARTAGPRDPGRRRLFAWAGGAAAAGVLAGVAGSALRTGAEAAAKVRAAIRLPAPAAPAPTIPPTTELGIPDLATYVTPNDGFYRIDTALIVPELAASEWTLRIHGLVAEEVVLTWDELLALPLRESVTTLACVSNEVGGSLVGNAVWLGYPIRELLARARPSGEADMVLSRSVDGFTASTPLEALTDDRDALLAVGMNGAPLPREHGFPVRMVVPGLYGYVSATKWLTELEVTRFDRAAAYWTQRGWSERGPIKLQSRIDVPRRGARVQPGTTVIAGVAWQQHVGVRGVEVQVDDRPWRPATLASAVSDDTWVQWSLPWLAESGRHRIRCRATNADGETQTATPRSVVPDGATGWHTVEVDVA